MTRQRSNTLPKSFGSQLEKKPVQEKVPKPPVESTLEGVLKRLQEKRDEVNRPEDIKVMHNAYNFRLWRDSLPETVCIYMCVSVCIYIHIQSLIFAAASQHCVATQRTRGHSTYFLSHCYQQDMTREQIGAEKVALQKALLYYESIHGRPVSPSRSRTRTRTLGKQTHRSFVSLSL